MTPKEAIDLASAEADARGAGQWAHVFEAALEAKGYAVTPLEATTEMRNAGYHRKDRSGDAFRSVYRAMLAERPKIGD